MPYRFAPTMQQPPIFKDVTESGEPFETPSSVGMDPVKYYYGLQNGYRIDEKTVPPIDTFPDFAQITSGHKTLPDIFNAGMGVCISERFKDMIEMSEPNLHQYLPIKLLRKNKKIFPGQYFRLNICQVLETLVPEKSNLRIVRMVGEPSRPVYGQGYAKPDFRALQKGGTIDRHLWREKAYLIDMYMSDKIYEQYRIFDMKGLDKTDTYKVGLH